MHGYTEETERLAEAILAYACGRLRADPVSLDRPRAAEELDKLLGETITADGIGGEAALRLFADVLAPACISIDHPRFLSFIPSAPTPAATLFDLAAGAASPFGGSWLAGAGAVHAENQTLRWLADLAGLPPTAGGVFVQGGTLGNLSALVTARDVAARRREGPPPDRWVVAATAEVHSSVKAAAAVMDVDLLPVATQADGRLTGNGLRAALGDGAGADGLFAVVATAGTTNFGTIDDLDGVADVCEEGRLWLHVDGAYGAAALAAPSIRHRFAGIERSDSFVVDPHKWLFAPFDCCALVYRNPELAWTAHSQKAGYLEPIRTSGEWNPSDYAVHLSRRARGLPFWFSLATHGTRAYAEAIERTIEVARAAAQDVRGRPYLELLREPQLSVVVFRRVGWPAEQYHSWSDRLLREGFACVTPTTHEGETLARFAIVNPRTTEEDVSAILDSMA